MKYLGVLVDKKLNISWQCVLRAQKAKCASMCFHFASVCQICPGLHQKQHGQKVRKETCEIPPEVLCPALGPRLYEEQRPVGVSPGEAVRML